MAKSKKPDMKELVKNVKALNKAELTDEIDLDDFENNVDGLADAFCTAIETIDDANKGDEIPKKVLSYHDSIFEYVESMAKNKAVDNEETGNGDLQETLEDMSFKDIKKWVKENGLDYKVKKEDWEDEPDEIAEALVKMYNAKSAPASDSGSDNENLEDKLEEMEYKEFKAFVKEHNLELKNKIKKSSFEDDQDELIEEVVALLKGDAVEDAPEFNEGELQETLEDMNYKQVKAFCKEKGLDYKPKKSSWEDDPDEDIEKIIALMKPAETKEPEKETKKGKGKKERAAKESKEDTGKSPFKANSKQEKLYNRIVEGECTVNDLAVILNGKKAGADKKWNAVVHMAARTLAKKVGVTINWHDCDTVGAGVVTLTE